MTNTEPAQTGADAGDGLVSRLSLIEERPLSERAAAYERVHDELSRVLEGGDPEHAAQ